MHPLQPNTARLARRATVWTAALAAVLAGVIATPPAAYAGTPSSVTKIPGNASLMEVTYAPAMDYDNDGCYPVPAVDSAGNANPGRVLGGDVNGDCHDYFDLYTSNAYSRMLCNNGWCGIVYGYYFEKDQIATGVAGSGNGHIHDWEHVTVYLKRNSSGGYDPQYVAASAHGGVTIKPWNEVRTDNSTHAKIVYHKDGPSSHAMRFAAAADDGTGISNASGEWHYPEVVGWSRLSSAARNTLNTTVWKAGVAEIDEATAEVRDGRFFKYLNAAKGGKSIPLDPNQTSGTLTDADFWREARSAYGTIPATAFDSRYGTSVYPDAGGPFIGNINDWTFTRYGNVDFMSGGATKFVASVAVDPQYAGRTIEVWLDDHFDDGVAGNNLGNGTHVATLKMTSTGGWYTFGEQSTSLLKSITGVHSVYLVGHGGAAVGNIKNFRFSA